MSVAILRGDARSLPLPDASVDLIVTSPPYYGLRSYTDGGKHYDGQIGSEETPGEWLANLVECTREMVRVLKPSGSIFINLGDTYAAGHGGSTTEGNGAKVRVRRSFAPNPRQRPDLPDPPSSWSTREARVRNTIPGVPVKSLLGMPWRFALGCMDELGLILRRDIVWRKTNPLPESATDRCATVHEYLFHFVTRPRYYSAIDEIREPQSEATHPGRTRTVGNRSGNGRTHRTFAGNTDAFNPLGKLPGSVWDISSQQLMLPEHLSDDHFAAFPFELPRRCILGWSPPGICVECGQGRWPVTESRRQTFYGAGRFRSGAQQMADGAAVTGWSQDEKWRTETRILGYACACTPYTDHEAASRTTTRRDRVPPGTRPQGTYGRKQAGEYERVGPWREYHLDRWSAPPTRQALVIDPFGGTGTTALVADVLGRYGISFDLSAGYCRAACWRITDPGERARAMQVPKPPPVPDGQGSLFDDAEATA